MSSNRWQQNSRGYLARILKWRADLLDADLPAISRNDIFRDN